MLLHIHSCSLYIIKLISNIIRCSLLVSYFLIRSSKKYRPIISEPRKGEANQCSLSGFWAFSLSTKFHKAGGILVPNDSFKAKNFNYKKHLFQTFSQVCWAILPKQWANFVIYDLRGNTDMIRLLCCYKNETK